jgi:hypothetical protein
MGVSHYGRPNGIKPDVLFVRGQLGFLSYQGAIDISNAVPTVLHQLACLFHEDVRASP